MDTLAEVSRRDERVLTDVIKERGRQLELWGIQHNDRGTWSLVLGEEFGESCKAALQGSIEELREELIHVAAVAVAWVSDLDWQQARITEFGAPIGDDLRWIDPEQEASAVHTHDGLRTYEEHAHEGDARITGEISHG